MDYYQILGLQRGCSSEDIKRAYKKLAIKYHPDKHPEDKETFEKKFKEISEAYSVLGDEEKRNHYDHFGTDGGPGFDMPDPRDIFKNFFGERRDDSELVETIQLPLNKIYSGCSVQHTYRRKIKCESCLGTRSSDKKDRICNQCQGKKMVLKIKKMGFMVQQIQMPCPGCHGTGGEKIPSDLLCIECNGKGYVNSVEDITIRIPRGVHNSVPLIIKEQGNYQNNKYNDLSIIVTEIPSKQYQRGVGINDICSPNPLNLLYHCDIDILDLLTNDVLSYKHLDGKTYNIRLQISDFNKSLCIVPRMGMIDQNGDIGDLFINVAIKNRKINNKIKKQLCELLGCAEQQKIDIDSIDLKNYIPTSDNNRHEFSQPQQCSQQ